MTDFFVRAKLLGKRTDVFDYTTYAFINIDTGNYILCTRFPRWEHKCIEVGEEGILHFREVIAGKDTWYKDGIETPYNYTGWHFVKFVKIEEKIDNNNLIID